MKNLAVIHINNGSDLIELLLTEDLALSYYSFDERKNVVIGKLSTDDLVNLGSALYREGMNRRKEEMK